MSLVATVTGEVSCAISLLVECRNWGHNGKTEMAMEKVEFVQNTLTKI